MQLRRRGGRAVRMTVRGSREGLCKVRQERALPVQCCTRCDEAATPQCACRMTSWQIFAQPVFDLLESRIKVSPSLGACKGAGTHAGKRRAAPRRRAGPCHHQASGSRSLPDTGLAHPPPAAAGASQGRTSCCRRLQQCMRQRLRRRQRVRQRRRPCSRGAQLPACAPRAGRGGPRGRCRRPGAAQRLAGPLPPVRPRIGLQLGPRARPAAAPRWEGGAGWAAGAALHGWQHAARCPNRCALLPACAMVTARDEPPRALPAALMQAGCTRIRSCGGHTRWSFRVKRPPLPSRPRELTLRPTALRGACAASQGWSGRGFA